MGFTEEQSKELKAKLNQDFVKSRKQGTTSLSYVEGWHVIDEANRIFGFDGWSRETVYLKEVCRYETDKRDFKTGQITGKNQKVSFEAKVRVTAGGVIREGTGYGQGTMGDLYDAMESAGKEAETDAMKRAMMTFGYPFGLALYDKTKANVESVETQSVTTAQPDKQRTQEPVKKEPTQEERENAAIMWVTGYLETRGSMPPEDHQELDHANGGKIASASKYPEAKRLLEEAGVAI